MEGATRRSHLVGTTSGSKSTSHAILSSLLIVCRFFPRSFYVSLGMVRFTYLRKHLGTIPPSIHLTDIAASAWDQPRRGHLIQPTISHLWRSAQAVTATIFVDQRRPLLPSTANENRSYKPAPWPTPSRRSKDLSKLEDAMSERSCTIQGVGERESGNEPDNPLLTTTHNTKKTGTMSSGQTFQSLLSSRYKSPNETCPKSGII